MDSLREMARRLRHDLIKHLDIPNADTPLTLPEAQVLLRRLYEPNAGLCKMGEVWVFKIRQSPGYVEAMALPLHSLSQQILQLRSDEDALRKRLLGGEGIGHDVSQCLRQITRDVDDFDGICQTLDKAAGGKPADDAVAALDFFGFGSEPATPSPSSSSAIASVQPVQKDDRIHVLVVDDRLLSIERLQAREAFSRRFVWATLCGQSQLCRACEQQESCPARRARNYREALQALEHAQTSDLHIDVLLMDVRFDDIAPEELLWLPDMPSLNQESHVKALQGLIIARALRQNPAFSRLPIVLMTARSRLPDGANQLLDGLDGLQFVDDDASLDVLADRLEGAVRLRRVLPGTTPFFWGRTAKMQAIRRQMELVSVGPRTVLISGPSGSGKSYIVEQVIYPLSQRASFVTLDLSAVPDTLVESELFGHVKGAFSGASHDRCGLVEEADGGILFLDEIGNLSLENQRKLLLFLQDKMVRRVGAAHNTRHRVDVKVIAATHLDLAKEVSEGRFRFDLYMRLGPAVQILLPSLVDRREDFPELVAYLVSRIVENDDMKPYVIELARRSQTSPRVSVEFEHGSSALQDTIIIRFTRATRELFLQYPWPGNTREMESVLDALVLKAFYDLKIADSTSKIVEIDHYYALSLIGALPKQSTETPAAGEASSSPGGPALMTKAVQDFAELRQTLEREYLRYAYAQSQGDLGRMGMMLFGQDSPSLRHKITVRLNQLGLRLRAMRADTGDKK